MKKLTILADMDDTIENLPDSRLHMLNVEYGCCVTKDDIKSWNIQEAYPDLTQWEVYAPLFRDELWKDVKPKWDAVKYLKKLQEEGHDIYITTSSNFRTIHTKVESILHRYFPFIDDDHVIVATKKQMIRGDVMVDDAPHNLIDGEYGKILMDAPHNQDYDAWSNDMMRARNWYQVYCFIVGNYALEIEEEDEEDDG